ncbi:MAG: hypothetical protein ACRDWI_15475 [Jiangellaceae bacterium]
MNGAHHVQPADETGTRVTVGSDDPGFTAGFASLDAETDVAALPVTGTIGLAALARRDLT